MAEASAVGQATTIMDGTFYGWLSGTERRWLQQRGTVRVYQAGYIMTMEGESAENVMVLMHGIATASCVTTGGAELLLRVYGAGDIIGDGAILGDHERPETVQALARCSALLIPARQFADLHRSAGIARAFGMAMTRRVQAADEQARIRLAPPLVRLACALTDVATRVGISDGDVITIPVDLSQDTLATWIAASRATVARMLAELRQNGIIRTGYRRVTITDPTQLYEVASAGGQPRGSGQERPGA
jgi:CRP-like cAMP-binding protein